VLPQGVVFCGVIEGPFDVAGVNPASTAVAPTLLVTNTSAPFLTLQGFGAGVTTTLSSIGVQCRKALVGNSDKQ
jgi:hypothetical protein